MNATNLELWLTDPRFGKLIGRPAEIRLAVLAHYLTGHGSLAEIARRFDVSKQSLTRHARKCREAFGEAVGKQKVDSD